MVTVRLTLPSPTAYLLVNLNNLLGSSPLSGLTGLVERGCIKGGWIGYQSCWHRIGDCSPLLPKNTANNTQCRKWFKRERSRSNSMLPWIIWDGYSCDPEPHKKCRLIFYEYWNEARGQPGPQDITQRDKGSFTRWQGELWNPELSELAEAVLSSLQVRDSHWVLPHLGSLSCTQAGKPHSSVHNPWRSSCYWVLSVEHLLTRRLELWRLQDGGIFLDLCPLWHSAQNRPPSEDLMELNIKQKGI